LLPDLELHTIRIHYVLIRATLIVQVQRPPSYKCFRCRIFAWRGTDPPYEFSQRTPCPHHFPQPWRVRPRCEWLPKPKLRAFVLDSKGLFCYTPPSLVECPVHGTGESASEPIPVASNPAQLGAQALVRPLRPPVRASRKWKSALVRPLPHCC